MVRSNCNGLDGRGQGPLAQAMKIVPADLRQISAKHAGSFPESKVADVIRNGGAVLAIARGNAYLGPLLQRTAQTCGEQGAH
jgi:hypothetical protein